MPDCFELLSRLFPKTTKTPTLAQNIQPKWTRQGRNMNDRVLKQNRGGLPPPQTDRKNCTILFAMPFARGLRDFPCSVPLTIWSSAEAPMRLVMCNYASSSPLPGIAGNRPCCKVSRAPRIWIESSPRKDPHPHLAVAGFCKHDSSTHTGTLTCGLIHFSSPPSEGIKKCGGTTFV